VITQEHEDGIHPIAFHLWSLLDAEKNYDAHNKEMLGVIYRLKMGRKFFLGAQELVQIWTDHKNLQYFREPQKLTGWQARWVTFMQDYNFTFEYIPGETNIVADLLSQQQDLNKGVSAEKQIMLPNSFFHICKISPHADNYDPSDSLLHWKIYLKMT
jgi:RNase H-like domain found in reverse transcriptase